MRSRTIVGALLFVGLLIAGSVVTRGDSIARARQWSIVYLAEPTLIGSTIVKGPVLFVHDAAQMARGEPCTTVRLVEPGVGLGEEITRFHCIPTPRETVNTFTIRTRPNTDLGYGCVLTEYQFAGDREGHAVPLSMMTQ